MFWKTHKVGKLFELFIKINWIVLYFCRSDTCVIAAVFCGTELGTWWNYQSGVVQIVDVSLPLSLEFSDWYRVAARTVVGLIVAGSVEFLGKYFSYSFLCKLVSADKKALKESPNSIDNTRKNFVDLTSKFITYTSLGFFINTAVPILYKYLNIQRDAFFTEL